MCCAAALRRFDWEQYLLNYPQLREQGVDTKEAAAAHYLDLGLPQVIYLFFHRWAPTRTAASLGDVAVSMMCGPGLASGGLAVFLLYVSGLASGGLAASLMFAPGLASGDPARFYCQPLILSRVRLILSPATVLPGGKCSKILK